MALVYGYIDGEADYGYDPTNQLTSASYTTADGGHQPGNESFSFDSNGNRDSSGYTTGSDNLTSSDGTCNYQHDADGNTISRTQIASTYLTQYETTYIWDYRNRLTDVEYYDNNGVLTKHVHFVYDVFDHLIATEVDPSGGGTYTDIQRYVLDVSPDIPAAGVPGTATAQPVLEFDGNQFLTTRFLVGLDPTGNYSVVAQEAVPSRNQGGPVIWAADNNVGTVLDLVDDSGMLANHRVFSAFGDDVYESDPSLSYWVGFGGGHFDANTGLLNDYHRWYNPATGTWESDDPDGFPAGDTNLLRYAHNSPATFTDPTGLQEGSGGDDDGNFLIGPDGLPINFRLPKLVVTLTYDARMRKLRIMREDARQAFQNLQVTTQFIAHDRMFLNAIDSMSERSATMFFGVSDINTFKASIEADLAHRKVESLNDQATITATMDAEINLSGEAAYYLGITARH